MAKKRPIKVYLVTYKRKYRKVHYKKAIKEIKKDLHINTGLKHIDEEVRENIINDIDDLIHKPLVPPEYIQYVVETRIFKNEKKTTRFVAKIGGYYYYYDDTDEERLVPKYGKVGNIEECIFVIDLLFNYLNKRTYTYVLKLE